MTLTGTIDVDCTLGEGPVWDDRLHRLWWTDIQESRLYFWDWQDRKASWVAVPERLGSLGLTSDSEWLICAFASGFALFHPGRGETRWLARPERTYRGIRFNDGRVDRSGNFWSGTMVEDSGLAGGAEGALYRLSPAGDMQSLVDRIGISNGLAWSADGKTQWFADSSCRTIWRFNHEAGSARLTDRQNFAELPEGRAPDGSEVDAAGCLWNAEWGGSQVVRYRDDGTVDCKFDLPVSQPTCLAFGGPDLDHIFVTTAHEGLDPARREAEPLAGKVLILRTGHVGLLSPKFPIENEGKPQ
jgi:L-arabinonolactonase